MTRSAPPLQRRDQLFGYLLDYLRNQQGPWDDLSGELRFAGNRALHLAGQDEFEQLAHTLAERFQNRQDNQRPMRLAVLTAQEPNAFATAPSQCDGVLLTKGAFDRIQALARSSAYGLHALLVAQQKPDFPLVRAWGALPMDQEMLGALGSVVAHVMTAVLVHHEIAHLVLGHEWKWRNGLDQAAGEADPNQCLELDADLHAVHFTERYLADRVAQVPHDSDPLNTAWHHFLGDAGSRGLVVLLGAYLFLLAVTPHGGVPAMIELRTGSHPHLVVRQLLALLVQQRWGQVAASDAVDLVYFAAAINAGTLSSASAPTAEEVARVHGLDALSSDPDAFKDHIDTLGKQLARYEPRLNGLMRLSAGLRVRWFVA